MHRFLDSSFGPSASKIAVRSSYSLADACALLRILATSSRCQETDDIHVTRTSIMDRFQTSFICARWRRGRCEDDDGDLTRRGPLARGIYGGKVHAGRDIREVSLLLLQTDNISCGCRPSPDQTSRKRLLDARVMVYSI